MATNIILSSSRSIFSLDSSFLLGPPNICKRHFNTSKRREPQEPRNNEEKKKREKSQNVK